ncbi:lipocalin-like domain-containing protein [Candidatus Nitrospira bockiana]
MRRLLDGVRRRVDAPVRASLLPACWAILACLCTAPVWADDRAAVVFRQAESGYRFEFPRDHGSHDEFRTEWWYYTGHLTTEDGRRLGYELTFFRQGLEDARAHANPSRWAVRHLYLAHAAVSDLARTRFHYAEKVSRAGLGKAGAESGALHVWIDDWSLAAVRPDHREHHLKAIAETFAFDLVLTAQKDPVVHGESGISRKGRQPGQASHYYSFTRLATSGTLSLEGRTFRVHGTSWMDHEFGSGKLGDDQVGWDWFSMQFENGSELMLYRLRRSDGAADPASSGTFVRSDGTTHALSLSDVLITVIDYWTSPVSGARYPSGWRISIPSLALSVSVTPKMSAQELRTTRSTRVTYWEGAVSIRGQLHGQPLTGEGYVELTGYAEVFAPPS